MMGFGLPAPSHSNRHVYSSEDEACVRLHCEYRLWSKDCSTHRRYTQDLPSIDVIYISTSSFIIIIIPHNYLPMLYIPFRYSSLEGYAEEAALHSLLLLYILYIDLIHNVMHNTTHICTRLTDNRFTFIHTILCHI